MWLPWKTRSVIMRTSRVNATSDAMSQMGVAKEEGAYHTRMNMTENHKMRLEWVTLPQNLNACLW